ncbi:MAG TPA: winged helix DNA-binding domain-containing protein [Aggregatilinea sp.]|uniref:winged helix DNA-binding domain-containing protein n=1 Tax=Aggregatilinea sp. TaxID=2806333 RepID=UPI002CA43E6A|nr:winged helix DNA-binding domain-containing protein [Aggregatilinea sp.]HML24298.1 winged helix DNA-binding domain-containing protein [Aggregatilinea sp.]
MPELSIEQVRRLRMRAQRLVPDPSSPSAVASLVHDLGGIQSQDLPAATLAVRPRTHGLTAADVRQAREDAHTIALTWWVRGTLHLVTAQDVARLLPLLGPRFIRASQRRYKQLDLTPGALARGTGLLLDALHARGPLTRAEAAALLKPEGIPVEGQAIVHLTAWAAMNGRLCFGPLRDGKPTYAALDGWIAPETPLDPDAALDELAGRYIRVYGPATAEDFASWSGLSMSQARAAFERLEPSLVEVMVGDERLWMPERFAAWLDAPQQKPVVRLLPAYENYLLGYRRRDWALPDAGKRQVHPGGGVIRACVIVDGLAVGTWRIERKKTAAVIVTPFAALDDGARVGLEAEAQDVGRFLDLPAPVGLRVEPLPGA